MLENVSNFATAFEREIQYFFLSIRCLGFFVLPKKDFVIVFNGKRDAVRRPVFLFNSLFKIELTTCLLCLFLQLETVKHLQTVFVRVHDEVRSGIEAEDFAAFGVAGSADYQISGHHDAGLFVGKGETPVADMGVESFGFFVVDEGGSVRQINDSLVLAMGQHIVNIVDGEVTLFGDGEAHFAVAQGAVVPGLVHHKDAFLVVAVLPVTFAVDVVALADQLAFIIVFHQLALYSSTHVGSGDVAFGAKAFPPATMSAVVGPIGDLGGVAIGVEDDLQPMADTHLIVSQLDELALLGVELPQAVAVFLIEGAGGQEVAGGVVDGVGADFAGHGIDVGNAHGAVGVVVSKGAGLHAVDEGAFVDFGPFEVGFEPVALTTTLIVNLVLRLADDAGEEHDE